jgi:hypothetical protein
MHPRRDRLGIGVIERSDGGVFTRPARIPVGSRAVHAKRHRIERTNERADYCGKRSHCRSPLPSP